MDTYYIGTLSLSNMWEGRGRSVVGPGRAILCAIQGFKLGVELMIGMGGFAIYQNPSQMLFSVCHDIWCLLGGDNFFFLVILLSST